MVEGILKQPVEFDRVRTGTADYRGEKAITLCPQFKKRQNLIVRHPFPYTIYAYPIYPYLCAISRTKMLEFDLAYLTDEITGAIIYTIIFL
jgi:hypothetical protein